MNEFTNKYHMWTIALTTCTVFTQIILGCCVLNFVSSRENAKQVTFLLLAVGIIFIIFIVLIAFQLLALKRSMEVKPNDPAGAIQLQSIEF